MAPFTPGYSLYEESNVLANSGVVFFDSWRKKESLVRQYTTFHELAHNMSDKFSKADTSSEWLKLSGWVRMGDEWERGANSCMISKYGSENPYEDFAEVASAYRYNPSSLESKCPTKYKFMKEKVFGGMEYKDESQCRPVTEVQVAQVQSSIAKHLEQQPEIALTDEQIVKSCQGEIKSYPPEAGDLENCAFASVMEHHIPQTTLNQFIRKAGASINPNTCREVAKSLSPSSPLRQRMRPYLSQVVVASNYRLKLNVRK
jgi:transcriptional regulator NrdR family protein